MARKTSNTAERILDIAERLVQSRGFAGFSYADIARPLGIRKASIHHHFPTKDDLGLALVRRYHTAFARTLADIDLEADPRRKLERYARLYRDVLADGNRMCLCGMLAADSTLLPEGTRRELRSFFDANEAWLAHVLAAGARAGVLQFDGTPESQAWTIVTGLEGAMLVARSYADVQRFELVVQRLLDGLAVPGPARRRAPGRR